MMEMDDNDMMIALHELFDIWQKRHLNKYKHNIYEDLAEMLSLVAEEQGVHVNE